MNLQLGGKKHVTHPKGRQAHKYEEEKCQEYPRELQWALFELTAQFQMIYLVP